MLREGMWQEFLDSGTMRGAYAVLRDGGELPVRYDARAHHPLPGYFTSRLWRVGEGSLDGAPSVSPL
jgi:hypothetical protein